MPDIDAAQSGTFRIGGEAGVHRLGFGAMRVTGAGIWGPPEDRDEAIRTLRRLPELGIDFIDTANSYGPDVSEELIREALYPYQGMVIATKGGLTRSGPNRWTQKGDPEHLIAEAERSREKLGVERIELWQLHRIDSKVPRDEQFAAVRSLIDRGVIRFAGLSEVTVEEIEAARRVFPVATVQNRYNLVDRASEAVLDFCAAEGIGFMPWSPLAAGALAAGRGPLGDREAARPRARAGGAGLGAGAKPGDAADPGHLEGEAPGGERRERRGQPRGGGLRRARQGGAGAASGGVRATLREGTGMRGWGTRLAVAAIAGAGMATALGAADFSQKVKLDGHGRATMVGRVDSGNTATFAVSGKKGERLSIDFSSSGDPCGFDIYGPKGSGLRFLGGAGVGAYSGRFDGDGMYEVRVEMRGHRRGSCDFTLEVERGR